MNGWKRLWILLSVIWGVIILSFAAVLVKDTFEEPDGPWIKYRLNEDQREFYENLHEGEQGPIYEVSLKYSDGTEQIIRFPLLEDGSFNDGFDEKLNKLASRNNNAISAGEIVRFRQQVQLQNEKALEAKKQYVIELAKARMQNEKDRERTIYWACVILVLPPLAMLLMGFGVAWVRAGFRKNPNY